MALLSWGYVANAQAVATMGSYKYINSDHYLRFNYENDFFMATDEYYTQGIHFEYIAPIIHKFPLHHTLMPTYQQQLYGIAIQHNGNTPSSIITHEVLQNDHPYTGLLYLQQFAICIDPENKQRFSSAISLGIIGPAALAAEMQTGIHKALDNVTPRGWHNQVRNDLILNYEVNYEKLILRVGDIFMVDAGIMVRAGTLSDKATIGTTFMLGKLPTPYYLGKSSKFVLYLYCRPEAGIIAYDAALQGGMFNRKSAYTLKSNEIEHTIFSSRVGIAGSWKGITLEYFQTAATRSFKAGKPHSWGGIQVGVNL